MVHSPRAVALGRVVSFGVNWSGCAVIGGSGFTIDGKPISAYSTSHFTIEQMILRVNGTLCDTTPRLSRHDDSSETWQHECRHAG